MKRAVAVILVSLLILTYLTNDNVSAQSDSWTTKQSMSTARMGASTAVVDGKIFVIGGYKSGSGLLNTVEMYDPISNNWTIKSSMPTPRAWLGLGAVGNRIYAIGGDIERHGFYYPRSSYETNLVEVYNVTTDTWDTSFTPMPTSRLAFGVGVVNNKIYAIGGWKRFEGGVDTVEEYDPHIDSWTTKPPMPTPRGGLGVAVVGNKIHCIGGTPSESQDSVGVNEVYDISSNSWDSVEPMPEETELFGIGYIHGRIYCIGGDKWHWRTYQTATSKTLEYDITNNKWTYRTNIPTTRWGLSTAVVNESLYCIGGGSGFDTDTIYLTKNEIYTPSTSISPPDSPQELIATAGNGQVVLEWSNPLSDGGTSIINYKIYRSLTSGGESLLTQAGNVLTYTDTSVINDQTYYYKISAMNSVGESSLSNEVSATPTGGVEPGDSDQDGLLDSWEQTHFGDLSQDAGDDPDEDGFTNQEEYEMGTNPTVDNADTPDGSEEGTGWNPLLWLGILVIIAPVIIGAGLYSRKKKRTVKETQDDQLPEPEDRPLPPPPPEE